MDSTFFVTAIVFFQNPEHQAYAHSLPTERLSRLLNRFSLANMHRRTYSSEGAATLRWFECCQHDACARVHAKKVCAKSTESARVCHVLSPLFEAGGQAGGCMKR